MQQTGEYSPAYRDAWKKFAANGWTLDQLTAAEQGALEEDQVTKEWVQQLRTANRARPAPATAPRTEAVLAGKIARAIKAGLAGGPFDLSPLLAEAGERPTMLSATMSVVTKALMHKIAQLEAHVEAEFNAREHKGVWTGLAAYRRCNRVTHDGSEWTALQDSLSVRPGTSGHWRLTVKHGDKGARGPDGKPGRDGKDLR